MAFLGFSPALCQYPLVELAHGRPVTGFHRLPLEFHTLLPEFPVAWVFAGVRNVLTRDIVEVPVKSIHDKLCILHGRGGGINGFSPVQEKQCCSGVTDQCERRRDPAGELLPPMVPGELDERVRATARSSV